MKTLADMHFNAGETLVVGDMAVDILMGANAGAKTCGVTWGNGTKNELENAGATFIIDRMEEILEIVGNENYAKLCSWTDIQTSGNVMPEELTDIAADLWEDEETRKQRKK